MEITEKQFFDMAATLAASIFSNPSTGNVSMDSYTRQQIIAGVMNDLQQGLMQNGHQIKIENKL